MGTHWNEVVAIFFVFFGETIVARQGEISKHGFCLVSLG
jgi:hypothetical protein